MAYSTATQLQENVKVLAKTYTDATERANFCTAAITIADKKIETDLGRIIDFDLVPAIGSDPDTPDFINLLSQYWAAHISLIRMTGITRQSESMGADANYWEKSYNNLLEDILNGKIDLELSDGTAIGTGTDKFSNVALPDVKPRMGYGEYGEFIDKDDLEEQRDTETGGYTD